MTFKKFAFLALVPSIFASFSAIAGSLNTTAPVKVEPGLVSSLAQQLLVCAEQPYGVDRTTGHLIYGQLRSHCPQIQIAGDTVQITTRDRTYAWVVRDSEASDGGDLNDVFVQYDGREDQEIRIAGNVLAFSDPALSLLLVSGHRPQELPQVLETSLNRGE